MIRIKIATMSGLAVAMVVAGCTSSTAPAETDAGAQNDAASTASQVQVYLSLARSKGQLEQFVSKVSDPTNADFGRFAKNAAAVQQLLNVQDGAADAINSYLTSTIGLATTDISLDAIGSAYVATMPTTTAQEHFDYSSNAGTVSVPSELADSSSGAMVVTQFGNDPAAPTPPPPSPPTYPTDRGNDGTPTGCADALATGAYTPNQYQTAYQASSGKQGSGLTGKGSRVAIIGGFSWTEQAVSEFTDCFSLNGSNSQKPVIRPLFSGAQSQSFEYSAEAYLDVQMVLAMAPDTAVTTLTAASTEMSALIQGFAAVLDTNNFSGGELPHVVSTSFIGCESQLVSGEQELAETYLMAAAALGISVINAAGDSGFNPCSPGPVYPASSAYATGAGGTTLAMNKNNTIKNQTAWQSGGGSGGGGPSLLFDMPSWQEQVPAIKSHGLSKRLTPDVSLVANGDKPGLAIYAKRITYPYLDWDPEGGGTSAAAPMLAGLTSLWVQQRSNAGKSSLGLLNPLIYQVAAGKLYSSTFDDVTKGSTGGDSWSTGAAGPGYDMATGWGSPLGQPLGDYAARLG